MGLINWIRKKMQEFDDEVATRRPAAPASPPPPPPSRRSFEEARDRVTSQPRHRLNAPIDGDRRRHHIEADHRRLREDDGGFGGVGFDISPATFTDTGDSGGGRHHSHDTGDSGGGRHHSHDSGGGHYEAPSSPTTSLYGEG